MELELIRSRILETPLVQRLPESLQQRFVMMLLWLGHERKVSREEVLFKMGDKHADQGCVILEGMVRVNSERKKDKTIEAPDILGELQLFTPEKARTATVEVVVGGSVLHFAWSDLAKEARQFFNDKEFDDLKRSIAEVAWTRENHRASPREA